MTKYTSLAIALTASTFLSAPAIAASLTPALGENSIFSYEPGSSDNYDFVLPEANGQEKPVAEYYKIVLKPERFSSFGNVNWTEVGEDQKDAADVVAVQLSNQRTKYFKYDYNDNTDRIIYHTRQTALSGNVNADFIDITSNSSGGTIFNENAIDTIEGDFIGNLLQKNEYSFLNGSVIYNNSKIGHIRGNFIGNSNSSDYNLSLIYNEYAATIENITGSFIANYGRVISNNGTIENINADFIGNTGGVINNSRTIGNIKGNFIANSVQDDTGHAYGGVMMFESGGNNKTGNITADFINNYVLSKGNWGNAVGGAISTYNQDTPTNITGNFIGNYASSQRYAVGGAIRGSFATISGNFLNNYAISANAFAYGGAILSDGNLNWDHTLISPLTIASLGDTIFFSGNYTQDPRGKIYNAIHMNILTSDTQELLVLNTTKGGSLIFNDNIIGTRIQNGEDIDTYMFVDRMMGGGEEVGEYELQFDMTLKGDDSIDAATGTTTQYIAMNNDIVNAGTVTVKGTTLRFGAYQHEDQTAKNWDGKGAFVASLNADGTANRYAAAVTTLSLNNAVFDIANGYQDVVKLKGYSATDSFLHIDVDTDNMTADMLKVAGNVEGVTKMIVHASSDADIRGKGEILFAQSENDTTGNAGSFVVSRVYKSPYLFDVKYDQIAANSNKWYFEMNDEENPDKYVEPEEPDVPDVPDVPTPPTPELPDIPSVKPQPLPGSDRPVAPEVIGAESLPAAALAQNSNMVYNIMNKVSANRLYCPGCGFYDYYWNGEAFHNLWANAVYNTLRIKTPTDIDAEVWGLEAGGDLQHDLNNKLGLFLSYRKGNYDMNGDGKHHYSTVGSEIDIDSYLAGLYYRYDRNNWWTFATVYGGIQRVDLKTKDGIKSDTDGTEFGGSVELGYDYALNKTVYLTPSIGAFYTQVDYDDATDSAGKVAKYNTLRQLELEAGVKLTKAFVMDEGYANLYVKPSVVRTITDGDEVRITGLGKVNTLDDQTLGRIEIGGRYGFTEQLSAYGWANHTFGDDYKASTFGLGLSYSW